MSINSSPNKSKKLSIFYQENLPGSKPRQGSPPFFDSQEVIIEESQQELARVGSTLHNNRQSSHANLNDYSSRPYRSNINQHMKQMLD